MGIQPVGLSKTICWKPLGYTDSTGTISIVLSGCGWGGCRNQTSIHKYTQETMRYSLRVSLRPGRVSRSTNRSRQLGQACHDQINLSGLWKPTVLWNFFFSMMAQLVTTKSFNATKDQRRYPSPFSDLSASSEVDVTMQKQTGCS